MQEFSDQHDYQDPTPANERSQSANGVREPFSVRDAQTANWLIRKVKESRAYAERVCKWAEAELRRTKQEERFLLERYGPQLEKWLAQKLSDDGWRRKSLALPAGRAGLRAKRATAAVDNLEALTSWCKQNLIEACQLRLTARSAQAVWVAELLRSGPSDVKISEVIDRAILNDHIRRTGELPPGVRMELAGDGFYIE